MPPKMAYFMAISTLTLSKLVSAGIWDLANSRHICHDCLAFKTLKPLTNQPPITGLGGSMSAERKGEIHLICKTFNGKPEVLVLNKVQYIPHANVNLIS